MNFFQRISLPALLSVVALLVALVFGVDKHYHDADLFAFIGIGLAILAIRDR